MDVGSKWHEKMTNWDYIHICMNLTYSNCSASPAHLFPSLTYDKKISHLYLQGTAQRPSDKHCSIRAQWLKFYWDGTTCSNLEMRGKSKDQIFPLIQVYTVFWCTQNEEHCLHVKQFLLSTSGMYVVCYIDVQETWKKHFTLSFFIRKNKKTYVMLYCSWSECLTNFQPKCSHTCHKP